MPSRSFCSRLRDARSPGMRNDEEIAVVRVERRAGEHAQSLDDEGETEALIAAEREQCSEPCHRRIARRLPFGIDRHPFGKQLT